MAATSIRLPVTIIRGPTAALTVIVMTSSRYDRTAMTENPTIMRSTGGRWAKIRRRKRTRSRRRTRRSRSGDCANNILDRFVDHEFFNSQSRCQRCDRDYVDFPPFTNDRAQLDGDANLESFASIN